MDLTMIDWMGILETAVTISVALVAVFGGGEGVVRAVQGIKARFEIRGRAAQVLAATTSALVAVITVLGVGLAIPEAITWEWAFPLLLAVWQRSDSLYQSMMRDEEEERRGQAFG
jgi:hypothetical protein